MCVWNIIWSSLAPGFVYSEFLFQLNQLAHHSVYSLHHVLCPACLDLASFYFCVFAFNIFSYVKSLLSSLPIWIDYVTCSEIWRFFLIKSIPLCHDCYDFSFQFQHYLLVLYCIVLRSLICCFEIVLSPLLDCKLFKGRNSYVFSPSFPLPFLRPSCVPPPPPL